MDAAKRPDGEPRREADRERANSGSDRDRVYNGADRRPAQNHDAGYRSRWTVDAAGGRRRERPGAPTALRPADLLSIGRLPVELAPAENLPPAHPAMRLPIDLGPLMRLAQEACWSRFLNRPRHSGIADA